MTDVNYPTPITMPSGEDPDAARIRMIVREEFARFAKQTQGVAWVTSLDPLTVRLKSGDDIAVSARDASLHLVEGQRVSIIWAGDGYVVTGLSTGPDDPQTTAGGVFPLGAVCLWPVASPIPDGWEQAADLNGRFVVAPDDVTFTTGATGGALTHDHPNHDHVITSGGTHTHGGTGTQNQGVLAVTSGGTAARIGNHDHPIASTGTAHDHGGFTVEAGTTAESNLPPYTAAYIWIRRIS